jgi:hypothetical protein
MRFRTTRSACDTSLTLHETYETAAISFSSSQDIKLYGVLNYACSRAYNYNVSLTVFDDNDNNIGDTRQHINTDGKTEIYEVLLPEPVPVECGRVYTALVTMKRPLVRHHVGERGSATVTVGYVSINFYKSEKDGGDTGVYNGYLPGLLFR